MKNFLLLMFIIFISCKHEVKNYSFISKIPYDLENPSKKIKLNHNLREISGLSFYKKNLLFAVQDEKGEIFVIDYKKGKIINNIKFGKKGDFEAIEKVGDLIYVLRSDGKIFEVKNFDNENIEFTKYHTILNKKNNSEGMSYDKKSNSLLIACKDQPNLEDSKILKNCRSVYSFSIDKKQIIKDNFFTISIDELKNILDIKRNFSFKISGIAQNPITKNYYVIGTVGKLMIILNENYEIIELIKLNPRIFKKPEGICFSKKGKLFIANEGKKGKGNILVFDKKN